MKTLLLCTGPMFPVALSTRRCSGLESVSQPVQRSKNNKVTDNAKSRENTLSEVDFLYKFSWLYIQPLLLFCCFKQTEVPIHWWAKVLNSGGKKTKDFTQPFICFSGESTYKLSEPTAASHIQTQQQKLWQQQLQHWSGCHHSLPANQFQCNRERQCAYELKKEVRGEHR